MGNTNKIYTDHLLRAANRRLHLLLCFAGVTDKIYIDNNGDRKTSFTVYDMNPDNGQFEVRSQHHFICSACG